MTLQSPEQEARLPATNRESFVAKTRRRLNTFKVGLATGVVGTLLIVGGVGHAVFNVFKWGDVSFGPNSRGVIASPVTKTNDISTDNSSESEERIDLEESNRNAIARDNSTLTQTDDNQGVRDLSAGGDINVTIEYKDNSELPGFDAGKGYRIEPPNIGQFDDALLVTNVSFGEEQFEPETKDVFIKGKKYRSTFHLKARDTEPKRVAFSLENAGKPEAVFFQFGLSDWTSGTTTLTYLVKISADGELLWSGQLKYAEQQIASVVLDVQDYSDVVFEYQVVEEGGAYPYKNPIYFTEAKMLFE